MKKKGSIGIVIISAIFIFIIGMATINLILPEVTNFRIDMNCADADSISDSTKLTCLVGDLTIPYFILIILSISLGGILSRFVF